MKDQGGGGGGVGGGGEEGCERWGGGEGRAAWGGFPNGEEQARFSRGLFVSLPWEIRAFSGE